jgi:phosphotransferase system  glucose/maltose/N-acetylglucosamine-specific IIC component
MLTTSEKNFIRDWEIQKEGPKWKYYLQYIVAWTTVIFLSVFFLLKLVMADRSMGGWTSFFIIAPLSILLAALITHLVYQVNERKLQELKDREEHSN